MAKGNKFLTFLGFTENEEEEEIQAVEQEQYDFGQRSGSARQETTHVRPQPVRQPAYNGESARTERHTASSRPAAAAARSTAQDNVRVMPSNAHAGLQDGGVKMMIFQPQSCEDAQIIIDNLKAKRSVIINLEEAGDMGMTVLNIMSGAIYALDGNIRKVSKGVFLLAPQGVDISGNLPTGLPGEVKRNLGK